MRTTSGSRRTVRTAARRRCIEEPSGPHTERLGDGSELLQRGLPLFGLDPREGASVGRNSGREIRQPKPPSDAQRPNLLTEAHDWPYTNSLDGPQAKTLRRTQTRQPSSLLGVTPRKPVGPQIERITRELEVEVEQFVRTKKTNKKAIAGAIGISPPQFTRKLQLKGRSRFTVDEVYRLAEHLGGPLAWPWLERHVATRLTVKRNSDR